MTRNHSASNLTSKGCVVRAEGLEPSLSLRKNGFSCPATAFAALGCRAQGLGSGLSLHQSDLFRLRCCPSSLYTFPSEEPPKGLARDRHVTGFPEFEQFYAAGFPAGTQVFSLKSDASADSATPARF